MTKINFIILIFLIPPLFAKEVGEYIGKEEAQFIYKVYKEQYFEVNKIIQAGSQLEKVRSSLGQEECQKQAQPMQEYWNELNNKVKDFDRKAYHFIKTVTKKSLSCVSCNDSYFSKHCKLVDRGLEMLRPVYGERPGKRIYDTKKYPHNGLRFPKDGGPGVTPG